jgi:hypothetical protein
MFLLKSPFGKGHDADSQGRVCRVSPGKRRSRLLLFERLEDRLCLSMWSDPVNLGPLINGAGFDNRRPAISSDGLSLYFSSNRPGGAADTGPLWVSHRASVDDAWGEPQELGPAINDPSATSTSAPYFSTDQHWLFFYGDRTDLGGYGGADIYAAYRQNTQDDFGWQTSINLGPGVNTQYDDAGPAYFEDPTTGITTLYFNSDRPGGPGDYDIYASTLQGFARFGPAVLVPELSSPNRDTRMAIRGDGLEMFLTSNRPGGLGSGLNIWVSTRATTVDPWSTPENLGAPIDMEGFNDGAPALSADGNTMYFYSNRPGSLGVNDLWMSTRQGGGQAPPPAVRRLPGVDPGIVLLPGSFSDSENRGTSGNVHVVTAGQADTLPPQLARESQAAATGSIQRLVTDRVFAAHPSARQARDPLGWGTASEPDLLALNRLDQL